jgi:hypothetical protein
MSFVTMSFVTMSFGIGSDHHAAAAAVADDVLTVSTLNRNGVDKQEPSGETDQK